MVQSARSGYVIAEYGVGLAYEDGHGTQPDLANVRRWIQWAADKGLEPAWDKLRSLASASTHGPSRLATVMRAVKRSNVRAGPGTSYAKVDILEIGERVRVLARTGDCFRLEPFAGQPHRFVYGPLLSATGHSEVVQ
jgi:hypothetical protein